jgi:hypothetical protein
MCNRLITLMPWSQSKNLGLACNESMSPFLNNDIGVIIDYDNKLIGYCRCKQPLSLPIIVKFSSSLLMIDCVGDRFNSSLTQVLPECLPLAGPTKTRTGCLS